MKQLRFRQLIALLPAFLLFLPGAMATHIVGGEIGYRCLGENQYEIIVRVYRDCFNGSLNAPFDDPASLGIFDRDGLLVESRLIPFISDDTVTTVVEDCLVIPGNVCVHTTTYIDTIELEPIPGGYQLVYQRCCRNVTVQNIVEPLETGATYDIVLTEEAMRLCNSSPVFREWPPIFICADRPLLFDHSAIDIDGDSLVYELCVPFQGGTFAEPKPQPPNNPPYDTVVWEEGYSVDNVLGAGNPLTINGGNGLMQAVPGRLGQFVVGVCVKEYRDGQLLSMTRRDFQYNVISCRNIMATFESPDTLCDELTVEFTNTTEGADSFLWLFDFPNLNPNSNEKSPVFTFPDTGVYEVALISDPDNIQCTDTTIQTVVLINSTVEADFQLDVFDCQEDAVLELTDFSTDSISTVVSWFWEVIYGGAVQMTSNEENPEFIVPRDVQGVVRLTATTSSGCTGVSEKPFETGIDNPAAMVPDSVFGCIGDTVELNPQIAERTAFNYEWSPVEGLDDPNSVNPKHVVTEERIYTVTITPSNEGCNFVKDVRVVPLPQPSSSFNFSIEDPCSGLLVELTGPGEDFISYRWLIGDPLSPDSILSGNQILYQFPDTGKYEVSLVAQGTCLDTTTQLLDLSGGALRAGFTANIEDCLSDTIAVQLTDATLVNSGMITSWAWSSSDGQLSSLQNPRFEFPEAGMVEIQLVVTTDEGCQDTARQVLDILPLNDFDLQDSLLVCFGSSIELSQENSALYEYQWSPAEGLDDPNAANPVFSPAQTTLYTVTVSASGCSLVDSVLAFVPVPMEIEVQGDLVSCEPFTELTVNIPSAVLIEWLNENGEVLNTGPVFEAPVSGLYNLIVRAVDAFDCEVRDTVKVLGGPVDVIVPDSLLACLGENLQLEVFNEDPNDALIYEWSPESAFLSGTDQANPVLAPVVGEQLVFVEIENQFGCQYSDTVFVAIVDTVSNLAFETVQGCEGLLVAFNNLSDSTLSYRWDFGVSGTDEDQSTERNPTYQYPEAGIYTVTLDYAYPLTCSNPLQQPVSVTGGGLTVDFTYTLEVCTPEEVQIRFMDASSSADGTITDRIWTFSTGQSSNAEDPLIRLSEDEVLVAGLMVTDSEGCTGSREEEIIVKLLPELNDLMDTLVSCQGEGVFLYPAADTVFDYQWTPVEGLDDPTAPNPFATPQVSTTYFLAVTTIIGTESCTTTDSVRVEVSEDIGLQLNGDQETCGDSVLLQASANVPVSIEWLDESGGLIGQGPSIWVLPMETAIYTAVATYSFACTDTARVQVINNGVQIAFMPEGPVSGCGPQEFTIEVTNLDDNDTLAFNWQPAEFIIAGQGTAMPTTRVDSGMVTIMGMIENQLGCTSLIEIPVQAGELLSGLSPAVTVCLGVPTALAPGADTSLLFEWSPAEGLSATNTPNPVFTGTGNTTYFVTVTDSEDAQCTLVDTVEVLVEDLMINLVEDTLRPCPGDQVVLEAGSNVPGTRFTWYSDAELTDSIGVGSQLFVPAVEGDYFVLATSPQGCLDTARVLVLPQPFEPGLESPVTTCANAPTPINPNGNPAYTYIWSPTTGLDLSEPHNPIATLTESTTYNVTVSDPVTGCRLESSVVVEVAPLSTGLPESVTVCPDTPTPLAPLADTSLTYQWMPSEGLSNANVPNPVFSGDMDIQYIVEVSDPQNPNCTITDTVEVLVEDLMINLVEDTLRPCPGDQVVLEAGSNVPGTRFTWYSDAELTDSIGVGSQLFVPAVEGDYFVLATSPQGCLDTARVLVLPQPFEPGLESPVTTCANAPTPINPNGNPAYTYIWSPTTGLDLSEPHNPIATLTESTTYNVTVSDPVTGCRLESSVVVEVAPLSTGLPESVTVCPDTPTPLAPLADTSLTYQWMPSEGLSNANVPNPVFSGDMDIQYIVEVSDPQNPNCMITDTIEVLVEDLMVQVADTVKPCGGETVPLMASANQQGVSYTWYADADLADSLGTGPRLVVPVGEEDYFVLGQSGLGCLDTARIVVSPQEFEPGLESPQIACANTPTSINPNGDPSYVYMWSPTTGLDLTEPHSPIATLSSSIAYSVTVADPTGACVEEAEVLVEVLAGPPLNIAQEDTVCEGGSTRLTAFSNVPVQIFWFAEGDFSDTIGFASTLLIPEADPTITYIAVAINQDGCSSREDYNLIVQPFNPGLNSLIAACEGTPVELNPNGNPDYFYEWTPDEELDLSEPYNPKVTLFEDAVFDVVVMDTLTGCSDSATIVVQVAPNGIEVELSPGDSTLCEPDTLTLSAETNDTVLIQWYADPGLTEFLGEGSTIQVFTENGRNNFFVLLEEPATGCTLEDSIAVEVEDLEEFLPPTDTTLCLGSVVQINPDGDPTLDYEWSPVDGLDDPTSPNPKISVTEDITYTVRVSNPETGCITIQQVSIRLAEDIGLEVINDTLLCTPGATFTVTAGTAVETQFTWADNPEFQDPFEETGSSLTLERMRGARTIYVRAEDIFSCNQEDLSMIRDYPVLASGPVGDTLICEPGEEIELSVEDLDAEQGLTYAWSPASEIISDSATGPSVVIAPFETVETQVELGNTFGCSETRSSRVEVIDLDGRLSVIVDPPSIEPGESAEIRVEGCPECLIEWSPSSTLDTDEGLVVVATPIVTTEYIGRVSNRGCITEVRALVEVTTEICEDPFIFIPRAFTPNGDGENDILYVRGDAIEELTFKIYNRWGQLIFETEDQTMGWDGTFNGEDLPPDVYGYFVSARCINGEEYTEQGNVTLLR